MERGVYPKVGKFMATGIQEKIITTTTSSLQLRRADISPGSAQPRGA